MSKTNLLFFLILVLTFFSCSGDEINNKEKRNNHWDWWVDASTGKGKWIPLSDHPTWKNGLYTSFYYDGKIFEKGKIKDGKYVDTSFWFDREGKNYYYKLHNKDSAIDYIISDGPIKIFGNDGKIKMKGIVENHKASGKWTDYYKSGFVKRNMSYKNDTGWLVNYYDNEQIEDSQFVMGDVSAIVKRWSENGQLAFSVGWKNNQFDGDCLEYFENGQLKQKAQYVNGKVEGEGKYWYPSGKLKGIGNYVNGVKSGKQIIYFENGQIQMDASMIDGKLDGEQKVYDEKGKVIQDMFFKFGYKVK